ncbi:MAG: 30S ribosomal protein S6 [Desulfobacteraceae bacterium]|nr:30S ribosomal protein S6 [Desulfobacteraceae bacterium]MBC2750458.1 30S ribosomal protein S6 [Desulfobacteraceae bacterium]
MRRYETIVIVDPDLGEEQREGVFDKIRELIPQKGGLLVEFDEWGGRKLAYEIKKKQRGYYVRINYCGGGDLVSEMERQFRIDDRVMKYMTILLDTEADMERIQEAMTQAEQEAEAAATASEPAESPETATEAVAEAAPVEAEPETSPESTDSEAKKEEA